MLRVGISGLFLSKRIEEWADCKKIFFVLSIGRSGTQFLAKLLNMAQSAYVEHEPVAEDSEAYQKAVHCEKSGTRYINYFRKKEIYMRCRQRHINTYGEINSLLRRHCVSLEKAFPKAYFFHLIRDGRDVVRSAMSRQAFKKGDRSTSKIFPKKDLYHMIKSEKASRFEKLCWYWKEENRLLREKIQNCVRLEDILTDYDYFKTKLLNPLELEISKDLWEERTKIKENHTIEHRFPHWKRWEKTTWKSFKNICGAEMKKYGYKVN